MKMQQPWVVLVHAVLDTGTEDQVHIKVEMPGNYHTLCGLSLDDNEHAQGGPAYRGKSDCHMCYLTWSTVQSLKLRPRDFTLNLRKEHG